MPRTLSSLIEGGEQHVRLYITSRILYFRLDRGFDAPTEWMPVTNSRGKRIIGRSNRTLKRQLNYWDKQLYAATQHHPDRPAYELAWGWAITESSIRNEHGTIGIDW